MKTESESAILHSLFANLHFKFNVPHLYLARLTKEKKKKEKKIFVSKQAFLSLPDQTYIIINIFIINC